MTGVEVPRNFFGMEMKEKSNKIRMQNPILFISLHSNTNKNHSTRLTYATKAHKNIASEQLGMGMGICVLPPVTPH